MKCFTFFFFVFSISLIGMENETTNLMVGHFFDKNDNEIVYKLQGLHYFSFKFSKDTTKISITRELLNNEYCYFGRKNKNNIIDINEAQELFDDIKSQLDIWFAQAIHQVD